MSDANTLLDMPDRLGPFDALMHRGEANPRTRSGIMAVDLLDRAPDWERFRRVFEQASRRVPRMRQRVVTPTLPTTSPRWIVDPDFDLDFHVRRMRVPEPAGLREVLDIAEPMIQAQLDISRPLWSVTLIDGLTGDRAAVLFHMSHAVTDGMGGVALFSEIYDTQRDPSPRPDVEQPVPQDLTSAELMMEGIGELPRKVAGGMRRAAGDAVKLLGRVVRDPMRTTGEAVDYTRSVTRMMSPAAQPSPLLLRRGLASRSVALDVRLNDLRRAAHAAGGSVNDAYLAGLCGALARYHSALGIPIKTLPLAVPVSLRSDGDAAGGNRFTGVNLAAPIGPEDPALRIRKIRRQMTQRRGEAALDVVSAIAPVLGVLPTTVLDTLVDRLTPADVQASNVPFSPTELFLAGAGIERRYGIGPLPGVAVMAVMVSLAGTCGIALRYDRLAITDEALFARCLQEGFDDVLALSGDTSARSFPASFDTGHRS